MKHICVIAILFFSFVIVGCTKEEGKHQQTEYPERKHGEGETLLLLTKHQLEHIEFAVEKAEVKTVTVPLTFPGRIALNDNAVAHSTARAAGRVERVFFTTHDRVKKGEILLELYSQEFLAMQSEFVQSQERLQRLAVDHADYSTAKAIYESAKRKLHSVGLSEKEIDELELKRTPHTFLAVRAPFDGTLIEGGVRQGEFVQIGADFFTIANLSKLWVIADIFEHDLPLIHEGMKGEAVVAPYPAEKFSARLTTIYDVVDSKSRTIKARLEVDNHVGKLKPEMFTTIHINALFGGKSLKVPSSAVLGNKESKYVFVAVNDTTFEQRSVTIGFETQAYTEILSGVKPGESVVSKGTFYLKSERAKETFVEEE